MTKKSIVRNRMLYMCLIISFFHATLRPGSYSHISAYRILVPLIYLLIYIKNIRIFKKESLVLIFIFLWNLVTSLIFYDDIYEFIIFFTHILCIFAIYVVIKFLKFREENFEVKFYCLIDGFTVFTIVLFVFQYVFRFEFPNTVCGRLSLFYWTENELGMALAIMMPIYIFKIIDKFKFSLFLKISSIICIMFVNDNKLSIIGIILAFVVCFYMFNIGKIRYKKIYVFYVVIFTGIIIIMLFYWNPTVIFRDYRIDLYRLIFEPFIRIVTLEPYHLAGSIADRTDAIIYGIQELYRSKFLGIGLGNSINMLQMDRYFLATAKSMHNFIVQMIIELGVSGLIIIVPLVKKTFGGVFKVDVKNIDIVRVMYFVSFIFISMQSSTGIFSNYFVWTVLFYIVLYDEKSVRYIVK